MRSLVGLAVELSLPRNGSDEERELTAAERSIIMCFMLTSGQAWETIRSHIPRGEWLPVSRIYEVVNANAPLDESDRLSVSGGASARWQRTVRNALQRAKLRSEIQYERGRGFRLPPNF